MHACFCRIHTKLSKLSIFFIWRCSYLSVLCHVLYDSFLPQFPKVRRKKSHRQHPPQESQAEL